MRVYSLLILMTSVLILSSCVTSEPINVKFDRIDSDLARKEYLDAFYKHELGKGRSFPMIYESMDFIGVKSYRKSDYIEYIFLYKDRVKLLGITENFGIVYYRFYYDNSMAIKKFNVSSFPYFVKILHATHLITICNVNKCYPTDTGFHLEVDAKLGYSFSHDSWMYQAFASDTEMKEYMSIFISAFPEVNY